MLSLVISEEGRVQAGGDGKGHQGAELWKGKDGTNRQAGKILIEEYFFIPCLLYSNSQTVQTTTWSNRIEAGLGYQEAGVWAWYD